jgi:hypothetical protein
MIEFAIILPVLLLFVLMAIDFGRVFFGWVGLNNAARIGASYAATHSLAWGSPGDAAQRADYTAQILGDANALNCTLPGSVPAPTFPNGTDLGDQAEVDLSCNFTVLTPFVSQILGGTVTIHADSVFRVRAGYAGGIPVGVPTPAPTASPSPTPTPAPSATPAPTPQMCVVPSFIGIKANKAQSTWNLAGFTTTVLITRPPNSNYDIGHQSPAVGGQPVSCTTTIMTVSP